MDIHTFTLQFLIKYSYKYVNLPLLYKWALVETILNDYIYNSEIIFKRLYEAQIYVKTINLNPTTLLP